MDAVQRPQAQVKAPPASSALRFLSVTLVIGGICWPKYLVCCSVVVLGGVLFSLSGGVCFG